MSYYSKHDPFVLPRLVGNDDYKLVCYLRRICIIHELIKDAIQKLNSSIFEDYRANETWQRELSTILLMSQDYEEIYNNEFNLSDKLKVILQNPVCAEQICLFFEYGLAATLDECILLLGNKEETVCNPGRVYLVRKLSEIKEEAKSNVYQCISCNYSMVIPLFKIVRGVSTDDDIEAIDRYNKHLESEMADLLKYRTRDIYV